jgi:hypothetical protein
MDSKGILEGNLTICHLYGLHFAIHKIEPNFGRAGATSKDNK